VIGAMALAAAVASSALGFPAAAASTGVGMGTDYACLPVTAQPGQSYPLPLSSVYVQDTGSAAEWVTMSVTPLTWGPGARLAQVPASWVTFGSAQVSLDSGQGMDVPVTLHVPAGARPGPYESSINAIDSPARSSGAGGTVTTGAGATSRIVLTVGPSSVPAPPCAALDLAQASGKFPPWPTKAFATTGWKQVFARDRKSEPVTPDGGPTASAAAPAAAAPQAVTTPQAVTAAYKAPSKIPSDWAGWLVIILILGLALRWLLKLLGLGK
jgi:hypothetical protein